MTTNQNKKELIEIAGALDALGEKYTYSNMDFRFPDKGPYRRELYTKHMEFLLAGKTCNIRAFIAANRIGKSFLAGYETTVHLTGLYPTWWEGKRFKGPIKAWAAGVNAKQVSAAIQETLFGSYSDPGTGLIPKRALLDDKNNTLIWAMPGVPNCIGEARVRHYTDGVFDGWSEIQMKTYEQGWMSYQGSKRDWIWLDEEPTDPKIYSECLTRTAGMAGQEGQLVCTFTPLQGYSTVYLAFLPNGQMPENGIHPSNPNKKVVTATWEDCPHLSEAWKKSQLEEYKLTDPNAIEARSKGIAALGSGRIYPIDESFVIIPPVRTPNYWRKAYGLDPGWNKTACVWVAEDPDSKVKYVYAEYKHGKVVDVIHVDAIKQRGEWIPGSVDPHGAKHKRDDGTDKIDYFNALGLDLIPGVGDPTTLRAMILGMFESGALKIIENCTGLINEVRMFRYDINDPNRPAKDQEDHLCDALMYCLAQFDNIAVSASDIEEEKYPSKQNTFDNNSRSDLTGY